MVLVKDHMTTRVAWYSKICYYVEPSPQIYGVPDVNPFIKQTFVMSESVAQRLASPRWLPNTPPLTVLPNGEWVDSTGERTDLKIWTVTMDPRPRSLVSYTHPIRIRRNRTRDGIRGSAYCSASLHATDFEYHECRALIPGLDSVNHPWSVHYFYNSKCRGSLSRP